MRGVRAAPTPHHRRLEAIARRAGLAGLAGALEADQGAVVAAVGRQLGMPRVDYKTLALTGWRRPWTMPDTSTPPVSTEAFAGGGLMHLAAEIEGVVGLDACECDEAAVKTLRHNFPRLEVSPCDARRWAPGNPEGGLDLLVGGPPCQGFSIAGKQLGRDDPRNMWPQVVRWAGTLDPGPRVILMENAANMLSDRHRPYLVQVQRELARCGYWSTLWSLNAADYGTPQLRKRAWLVAAPFGAPWIAALASPPPPTHGDPRKPLSGRAPWVRAFDRLNDGCCGGYGLSSCAFLLNEGGLCAGCYDGSNYQPASLDDTDRGLTPGEVRLMLRASTDGRRPIDRHPVIDYGGLYYFTGGSGRRMAGEYLGPTVTKNWAKRAPHGLISLPGAVGPEAYGGDLEAWLAASFRWVTQREAAKLQDVPVWYEFRGSWRDHFRQIGNGIPVNMGRAVVRHALRALGYAVPVVGSMAHEARDSPPGGLFPLEGSEACPAYGEAFREGGAWR